MAYRKMVIPMGSILAESKKAEVQIWADALFFLNTYYRNVFSKDMWVWFQLRDPHYGERIGKSWKIELVALGEHSITQNELLIDLAWAFRKIALEQAQKLKCA